MSRLCGGMCRRIAVCQIRRDVARGFQVILRALRLFPVTWWIVKCDRRIARRFHIAFWHHPIILPRSIHNAPKLNLIYNHLVWQSVLWAASTLGFAVIFSSSWHTNIRLFVDCLGL
jgi:hypothetical protein